MLPRFSVHISRKLLCANGNYQKLAQCKFSHRAHTLMNVPFGKGFIYNVNKQSKIYGACLARYESTVNSVAKETVSSSNSDLHLQGAQKTIDVSNVVPENDFISEIPEPPIPPSITEEIIETIKFHANGEPTFSSIGLGGYGPFGLIQYYFEWVHISLDMPWWAVIVLTSFIIKIATIPLAIDQQKRAVQMQHVLPGIVKLQMKMTDARSAGNTEEAALYGYELQEFFYKNKIKVMPVSAYLRFAIHIPVFIAIRGMATTPVESLKEGGLFWFKDLTVADPYYLLPLLTTVTLYLVTEHTIRTTNAMNMSPTMQYLMRGLPILSFLFSMHFPGALLCHWAISNMMTMSQNIILKNKKVQDYFNIPPPKDHGNFESTLGKKGFTEAFRDSWSNMKVSSKLASHARADIMQFNQAARGPLKRTYKYNPIQDPRNATSMSAMKK